MVLVLCCENGDELEDGGVALPGVPRPAGTLNSA